MQDSGATSFDEMFNPSNAEATFKKSTRTQKKMRTFKPVIERLSLSILSDE